MLAMKVLSSVTYYNGTPHFAKEDKKKAVTLQHDRFPYLPGIFDF